MISPQFVLGFVFALLLISPALIDYITRVRRQNLYNDRTQIPPERIFRTFYRSRGLDQRVVETAWRELNSALGFREGHLRPFDELSRLGRYYFKPFDSVAKRIDIVLRGYLVPGEKVDTRFHTVDDVVVYICRQWQRRLYEGLSFEAGRTA